MAAQEQTDAATWRAPSCSPFDRLASAVLISMPMSIPIPPLPASSRVNDSGHLEIAGCDVVELANEYGTPLFIYDEGQIRERCQAYIRAFSARTDDFDIIYASKACTSSGHCQLLVEEGMSIDVASGGELYTALQASFPAERIYVHGNANTRDELRRAVQARVAYVILDSWDEAVALNQIAGEEERKQPVLLRITPGIEAHTHDFIQTGKLDSKFGVCLADGVADETVARVLAAENLDLAGFHNHIGSQIFSLEPFRQAVAVMAVFIAQCNKKYGFTCRILDLGGGLGASYTEKDDPAAVDELAEVLVGSLKLEMNRVGLPVPRLLVEPGRSIVANAGVTAYEVETVKRIPDVRTYVAVNGGMSDNMRTMLYGAEYPALIADRPEAAATTTVTPAAAIATAPHS